MTVFAWSRRLAAGSCRLGAVLLLALAMAAGPWVHAAAQQERWLATESSERVERAMFEQAFIVTVDRLNLRSDPSTANPPVGTLARDVAVLRLEETFNSQENRQWMKVRLADGSEGWIATRYVDPAMPALATVEQAFQFLAGLGATSVVDASPTDTPPTPRPAVDKIHAGFVYVGPVGDAGWTFSHDAGRRAMEALPFVEKTSYIESVPEDDRLVGQAIDRLVADGANLVFTTSFGFMDATVEAAKRHPDVTFMHASGFRTAPNLATYFGRMYQARYLSGMVAGSATQTGRIGYVAAFPIAEVVRGIDAFTLGARSVNPQTTVEVAWTGTWYGPGIESEVATGLVDRGADVLAMHQDSPAVLQVAEQRRIRGIGYHSDMSLFAPTATLTSAVWNWMPVYLEAATALHEGRWLPDQRWWRIDDGVVGLAPLAKDLPAGLAARVDQARAALANGSLQIFEGPIRDRRGGIAVPAGKVLSDAELLKLDYFVEGVEGGLPEPQAPSGNDN